MAEGVGHFYRYGSGGARCHSFEDVERAVVVLRCHILATFVAWQCVGKQIGGVDGVEARGGQRGAILRYLKFPIVVPRKHINQHRVFLKRIVSGHLFESFAQRHSIGVGGEELFHCVHVQHAHLRVAVVFYRGVFPFYAVAPHCPAAVSGRRAVGTHVGAGEFAGNPPRSANGGNVMLHDVWIFAWVGVEIHMGVTAHEMHIFKAVEATGKFLVVLERSESAEIAIDSECGDMRAHHHRHLLVHEGEVLAEPVDLLLGDGRIVVALPPHAFARLFPGRERVVLIHDVVEHHIVHFAQVVGIVVRANHIAPQFCGKEVGVCRVRHSGVVVVIANHREKRHRIVHLALVVHEIAQCVFVGVPKVVPSQVAQNH